MTAAAGPAATAEAAVPEASAGALPDSLLRIREPQIRLAVWRRRWPCTHADWLVANVRGASADCGAGGCGGSDCAVGDSHAGDSRAAEVRTEVRSTLDPARPLAPALDAVFAQILSADARATVAAGQWRRDLLDLLALALRIAPQSPQLKLRVQRLEDAGCPLFHVDRVPLRMLCAYAGAGTEWLPEYALDRSRLGTGSNASVRDWSAVRALAAGEVAVMKGEAYPGNAGRGLVHRSPDAAPDRPRLIVAIDFG